MVTRLVWLIAVAAAPVFCADWNPQLAAQYMDSRQKEWFAWPAANANGVRCVSCHTGLTYLLARPALRRNLSEAEPTPYEIGLVDGMKSRVAKQDVKELFPHSQGPHAVQAMGVETVFTALVLAMEDARRGKLSPETEKAFDRLWALQIADGKAKGAWEWNTFDLDPWEMPESAFYGAALAAMATGIAPGGYQSRPEIRENVASLTAYLRNEQDAQPLHNRLILLWASAKLPHLLSEAKRKAIVDEARQQQQADGGWTLESLGAWKKHADAPPSSGSNSYATGLVAFTLQQGGVARSNPTVAKALDFLRAHQDPTSGYWVATSMNKSYKPDSMPARFMQDAATAYASLALLGRTAD